MYACLLQLPCSLSALHMYKMRMRRICETSRKTEADRQRQANKQPQPEPAAQVTSELIREQKIVIYSTCFMLNANSNLFIFNIQCSRPVPNKCPFDV